MNGYVVAVKDTYWDDISDGYSIPDEIPTLMFSMLGKTRDKAAVSNKSFMVDFQSPSMLCATGWVSVIAKMAAETAGFSVAGDQKS